MAIVLMVGAGWAAQAQAQAQAVYRCGNSYSQKPCAGGAEVQVDDARSAGQQKQTAEAAQRDARSADAMEKARLKQEGRAAPAVIPPKADPLPEPAPAPVTTGAKAKKPQYFTAVSPKKPGDPAAKKKKKPREEAKER